MRVDAALLYVAVASGRGGAPTQHELVVLQKLSESLEGGQVSDEVKPELATSRARLIHLIQQVPFVDLARQNFSTTDSNTNEDGKAVNPGIKYRVVPPNGILSTYPELIDQFGIDPVEMTVMPPPMLAPGVPDPRFQKPET
ncbi:MAG: hypothetical protein GY807_13010 [Gammaproteobacteria bacterium]|nr:hypothetical protein [Gammaproteobacteria bacterium]